jgi:hypothetical protein
MQSKIDQAQKELDKLLEEDKWIRENRTKYFLKVMRIPLMIATSIICFFILCYLLRR